MAPKKSGGISRYQRYLRLIEHLHRLAKIDLVDFKADWPDEPPGFLTRIVGELESQGWLVRETEQAPYTWNRVRGEFSAPAWIDKKLYAGQIKTAPADDRPRERLLALGVEKLKTSELIAILIRSGRPGESAVVAGEKIAVAFREKLDRLPAAGRGELKHVSKAVATSAYCQIMAGIELGRRVAEASERPSLVKISSSEDAIAYCRRRFDRLTKDAKREEFHIVTLDTKNQVIDTHQISVGTLDASLVHPREVFHAAIKDSARSILLVHNHPSGDPTPSPQDRQVTDRLSESGNLLGIEVLDHIVLGRDNAISVRADQ
jgi:DNA repair protein RadC